MDIKCELIPYDGFIGSKEFDFDKAIYDLNSQIELLSSQADNLDYVVAIASGIACGLLDILWVGEFDLTNGRSIASDKVDAFVKKTAEMFEGEKFDDVKSAVKALEKRFPIPSDGNTPDFGGGLQHHLRDFAHHPTIVGLAFSLLTQFTEKSYGTDVNGVFLVVDVPEKSKPFIGKDVPQKILMGTITWFFHLVSDVAGSSSTAGVTGGTGIPGPILALAKEISAILFFKDIKVDDDMSLSLFVTSVDTASEALAVSLSEKARVDLDYMAELTGKDVDTVKEELTGIIFQNPLMDKWETADEYLSGNVRDKLETAKVYAESHPEYAVNVQALTQVQPKELDASEIEVHVGATWIAPKYIEDFMRETFEKPQHLLDRNVVGVQYSDVTGQWNIKGKNADYGNSLVNMTYGTSRRNAYTILEDSLNLKDSRVFDTIEEDGKEKRVLNKKETTIASQKQEAIREAFKDWVFRDPERRLVLVAKYNQLFNSTRPREYDGSHLKFPGMTPDIELKTHQKNAVAHVLYGDNTLLAHCVGAGKTFEMTAAAMESKRLGLCQKSLFVVPNHLTEQWASDFLRLYPGANILAATKKDFEPANRKKFCSRIATGDYDAVIIGHSQFEKIPLSQERQVAIIER